MRVALPQALLAQKLALVVEIRVVVLLLLGEVVLAVVPLRQRCRVSAGKPQPALLRMQHAVLNP